MNNTWVLYRTQSDGSPGSYKMHGQFNSTHNTGVLYGTERPPPAAVQIQLHAVVASDRVAVSDGCHGDVEPLTHPVHLRLHLQADLAGRLVQN